MGEGSRGEGGLTPLGLPCESGPEPVPSAADVVSLRPLLVLMSRLPFAMLAFDVGPSCLSRTLGVSERASS